MTALLDIDVEALFQQHNVSEIDLIQKKLQTEVERKREDLRSMVGERYRDLLQAADTIAEMKQVSESLIGQVDHLSAKCRSLNEEQLIGFKTETHGVTSSTDRQMKNYFGTVVQIKILTSLPEMIWTQIDNENFYLAAQLFMLSRHISTGLQVDVDNSVMKYLPVAKKQWSILSPFFFTIKQNALSALERESLTADEATNFLLSLYLLEKTSLNSIINTFVGLRAKAFVNAMSNSLSEDKRVKNRILESLQVLNSSVELMYTCFIDSGKGTGCGTLSDDLNLLTDKETSPTISYLELDDVQLLSTLPDIILNFKPTIDKPTLQNEAVKTAIEKWISNISNAANKNLKILFDLISSIKTCQEIKSSALSIEKPTKWIEINEKLFIPKETLNFYKNFYDPLINKRIKDLISKQWSETLTETLTELKNVLNKATDEEIMQSELNRLWSDDHSDVPKSLKDASKPDKKQNPLLMKSKGYDKHIIDICASFDQKLENMISDISAVMKNVNDQPEKFDLVNYLRELSEDQTNNLISEIKSLEYNKEKANIILLARLLSAMIELCPNLKSCITQSYVNSISTETASIDKKNFDKWSKICRLFEDEAFNIWMEFCKVFLDEIKVEDHLLKSIGFETVLKDFVKWETITIDEKDDDQNMVQSTFRTPVQPRILLQQYLFKIIHSLNASVPQTLPRKVLQHLIDNLIRNFIQLYESYIELEFVKTNQNTSLQLYFDLKFLQMMFTTRENKPITDKFNILTTKLRNYVDPFDFELFQSHLTPNVKSCIQKMQTVLGALLLNDAITSAADKKATNPAIPNQDPNVLCLSSTGLSVTWFSLLPIIVPGSSKPAPPPPTQKTQEEPETASQVKPKREDVKQQVNQQTTQNYASNVKSGAAAFFGAMSQDWFR